MRSRFAALILALIVAGPVAIAPAATAAEAHQVVAAHQVSARWCAITWWDFGYYLGFGLSGWRWC
jgi:hypothetical protein